LSGRLTDFHQGLVDPDQDFRQGHDRDEKKGIKVWLKKKQQTLMKKIQARPG